MQTHVSASLKARLSIGGGEFITVLAAMDGRVEQGESDNDAHQRLFNALRHSLRQDVEILTEAQSDALRQALLSKLGFAMPKRGFGLEVDESLSDENIEFGAAGRIQYARLPTSMAEQVYGYGWNDGEEEDAPAELRGMVEVKGGDTDFEYPKVEPEPEPEPDSEPASGSDDYSDMEPDGFGLLYINPPPNDECPY